VTVLLAHKGFNRITRRGLETHRGRGFVKGTAKRGNIKRKKDLTGVKNFLKKIKLLKQSRRRYRFMRGRAWKSQELMWAQKKKKNSEQQSLAPQRSMAVGKR